MNSTNNKIAWVHLTSRIKQLVVAVLSVTFGISMYIFMNSFMNGVNNAQTDITFASMAHLKIYNDLGGDPIELIPTDPEDSILRYVSNAKKINYTEGIKNSREVIDVLLSRKEIVAITQQVNQNVLFRNGVTKVSGNLSGIDVVNEDRMFGSSRYMLEGDLYELNRRPDGVVLGSGLASKTGSKLGDNITLMTSEGVTRTFAVVGIIETGTGSIDKTRALISIQTARQLLSKNRNYATEVLANVGDYNTALVVADGIRGSIRYKTEAWQEGNGQLESANTLRDIIAVAVSLTILIVAGFGIYNIMNMTVSEKIREIAILKAMGYGGKDIVRIFLLQSVIIGVMGGLIGLVLGFTISSIVDRIPFQIASFTSLPISYNPTDYILAMAFGLLVTFVAGYLPAKKASKIDPVSILRG